MRKFFVFTVAVVLTLIFGSCSKSDSSVKNGETTREITVSGISGSINFTPIYIADEKGFFEEAGLEVNSVLFDNGPVQMEALASNSWDLGATGVGGVLSGVISYDALVVGASNSDNGTQTVWARNDSDVVLAGKGANKVNSEIYGDANSWKGKMILCNSGTVLEYLLIKTLGGIGLTTNDVDIVTMDAPTANSAFLAGQGDISVITGAISFAADKKKFTMVSSGNLADTGLMCNFVANRRSYGNPEKYESMKIFMDVYWKTIEWMNQNPDDAAQLCSDFNAECGITLEPDTAKLYLAQDPYYDLKTVAHMMHDNAEGRDYSIMEKNLIDVLEFFIKSKKYADGDIERFLDHTDSTLLDDVMGMNS